jgi:hypothetical protein
MNPIELSNALVMPDGDDPDAFLYAPKAPGIAAGADGRRQFNLLTAGPASFLQLTGRWGLEAQEVAALRKELAAKIGWDVASLKLRPLPETVAGASLLLADGAGGFTVLQQSKSSGIPPFHAAFNVMLDAERLKIVREALDGKRGQLILRYDITRRLPTVRSTVERVTTQQASEEAGKGLYRSAKSERAENRTTSETLEEITHHSAQLDAADWNAAR